MTLLIDGYNLLNSTGILGRGRGPGSLERARQALLNVLVESLPADQVSRTTVVFDASESPWGVARTQTHRGISVQFAAKDEDADTQIERLIAASSAPKRLTVVSSDHRLHRAARRRRARAVDSDVWYAEVVRRRPDRRQSPRAAPAKPHVPLSEEDVARWLEQFGGESELEKLVEEGQVDQAARGDGPHTAEVPLDDEASDKPSEEEAAEIGNPFPPGYGEDLLDLDAAKESRREKGKKR